MAVEALCASGYKRDRAGTVNLASAARRADIGLLHDELMHDEKSGLEKSPPPNKKEHDKCQKCARSRLRKRAVRWSWWNENFRSPAAARCGSRLRHAAFATATPSPRKGCFPMCPIPSCPATKSLASSMPSMKASSHVISARASSSAGLAIAAADASP